MFWEHFQQTFLWFPVCCWRDSGIKQISHKAKVAEFRSECATWAKAIANMRMLTDSFLWEPTTFPLPPALYTLSRPTPTLLYRSLSISPLHFDRYHQHRPRSWGDIHSGRTKTSTFRYCHMQWRDINSRDSRWGLSAQSASCGTFCVPMRFWLLGRWLTPARGGSTAWWDQGV